MGDLTTNNERISELIFKHLLRQLSGEEQEALSQWRTFSPENERVFLELTERTQLKLALEDYNQTPGDRIWQKITNEVAELNEPIVRQSKYVWFRIAVVAAIVLAVLVGGWLLLPRPFKKGATGQVATVTKDISPGGNRAILTLSDGTRVLLDSAQHGELARQGRTRISKKQEGEVVYNANHAEPNEEAPLTYNTITTPRGGQYHVVLPDGSHVWLNAASSIHFPTQFTGKERKVTVSGEAYFEVAKDRTRPFRVALIPTAESRERQGEIEVLGTHFNVNAYSDENYINTTLLEGSIRLTLNVKGKISEPKILSPGQRALLNKYANKLSITKNEEAESAVAWVKGVFHFEDADIKTVMRQLSRWYNVDVSYEGKMPCEKIMGDAEKNIPLSKMLMRLEKMTSVHFNLEGRTIRITQ